MCIRDSSTVLLGKSPELMELCAKSGCRGLLIGFESVSKETLIDCNKRFNTPATYAEFIRTLHTNRISVMGTFVFGSESDTINSFDEVKDFVLTHKVDLPRFSIQTPFPGTTLFKTLETEDRILTRDWSLYDGQHVVYKPKNMTPEELTKRYEKLWREVYSYKSIAKRIGRHSNPLPIIVGANIGYRFYAKNLNRFYNCNAGLL